MLIDKIWCALSFA